jgi:hypothetical protein
VVLATCISKLGCMPPVLENRGAASRALLFGFLTSVASAADQVTPSSSDLLLYIRPTAVLKTWSQECLPILATAPSMSHVSGILLAKLMLYTSHKRPCKVAALGLISFVPENASQQKAAVHCVQGGSSRAVADNKSTACNYLVAT